MNEENNYYQFNLIHNQFKLIHSSKLNLIVINFLLLIW